MVRLALSWYAARLEAKAMQGGMRGDGHELSILILLSDGDRAGRALEGLCSFSLR